MTTMQPDISASAGRWYQNIKWEPILFLAPAIIGLLVLTIYPLLYGLRLSLIDYELLSASATGEWNWFQNYTDLFQDKEFWNALKITLEFTIYAVVLEMLVGLGLALLLSQELRQGHKGNVCNLQKNI